MAFSTTETARYVSGNRWVVTGIYTNSGGGTGGDIETGLGLVEHVDLQPKGSAVVANAPAVNETLPLANGGVVTIVTAADEVGNYRIEGQA